MPGPGLLSVVATPIGNLEDVSLRALRVLRAAGHIIAEDTRRTAHLLSHHGIRASCVSFHAHNAKSRVPGLIQRLSGGEHLALVTDAGTPGVSDPGVELVQACHDAGIRVEVVPGASAPLTAAVLSGFPLCPLTILGFPPIRAKERNVWFGSASAIEHTFTFFEAPHRIEATARTMAVVFRGRRACVVREATKLHEECLILWSDDLSKASLNPRGEFTLVVGPRPVQASIVAPPTDEAIASRFRELSEARPSQSRKALLDELSATLGLSRNSVYRALERSKRSQEEAVRKSDI